MADLILGSTTAISESGGTVTLAGTLGSGITYPTGVVISTWGVIVTANTATYSNHTNWESIAGMSLATTPIRLNSDFFVNAMVHIGGQTNFEAEVRLQRKRNANGWEDGPIGDANSSNTRATIASKYDNSNANDVFSKSLCLLDKDQSYTLATDAIQYRLQWRTHNTNVVLNKSYSGTGAEMTTGISTIVVQEIAG